MPEKASVTTTSPDTGHIPLGCYGFPMEISKTKKEGVPMVAYLGTQRGCLRKAAYLVEAAQEGGSFAQMSGNPRRAAVQISKICNDLRWLSPGPQCGLYEITLPPMEPGSSIMPRKINPVIPEMVNKVCYQIIGYDMTISMSPRHANSN